MWRSPCVHPRCARYHDYVDSFRRKQLDDALASRILILDGAMGTMLQAHNPTAADFGGAGLENCNENLCRTRPEWILDIHRAYLEAGADIIETNSFQGSPIVLAEFGLADKTHELNVLAAQLARQAADEFSTAAKPRFVAGSHGADHEIAHPARRRHASTSCATATTSRRKALVEGGVDLLLIETGFDTRNVKAGLLAVAAAGARARHAHSRHGLRHHRALGRDARRPAGRRVLRLGRARRSACPSA